VLICQKIILIEGVSKLKEKARRRKGRGFEDKSKRENIKDEAMEFDSVDHEDDGPGPQRCNFIYCFIIFVHHFIIFLQY
jgi:hypothetical protein